MNKICNTVEQFSEYTEQPQQAVVYSTVHEIPEIKDQIDVIASEILRITLDVKKKNIKDINKNFQATLTNYFLECQVCQLLTKPMNLQYKRDVRKIVEQVLDKLLNQETTELKNPKLSSKLVQNWDINSIIHHIEPINQNNHNYYCQRKETLSSDVHSTQIKYQNMSQNSDKLNCKRSQNQISQPKLQRQVHSSQYVKKEKIAKYIMLIGIYGDFIDSFGLQKEFVQALVDNIKIGSNTQIFQVDSQKYITMYQKKLCAILVLQHYLRKQDRFNFKSFCDLWNSVFLNHKLFYFARETNVIYNKTQTCSLYEDCNGNFDANSQQQKKKKCNQLIINFYQQGSQIKKQKINDKSVGIAYQKNQTLIRKYEDETTKKSMANYKSIPQISPVVFLNYYEWAQKSFFANNNNNFWDNSQELCQQFSARQTQCQNKNSNLDNYEYEAIQEEAGNNCLINSPLQSSISLDQISHQTYKKQQLNLTIISNSIENREKNQTLVIIPSTSYKYKAKQKKQNQCQQQKQQTELTEITQLYEGFSRFENQFQNNVENFKQTKQTTNCTNENKFGLVLNQQKAAECSTAKYRQLQLNSINHQPASQILEYLSQFFSTTADCDYQKIKQS
ncbi:hypothetical protein TTHERM_00571830 (macronuclear) [Tetrahymena thermophila SB210]|uniref:Uncharacterized protein n=1 Tax=Tetrahymena thermophila (strain SB210) TaxID=312017 RepID=Q24HZ1_TETTS|nr:hypothetical protein TTHERM_00571830 [Tetrahymena thermophila SB210]EAS07447.1 hypothetical protein TTHERM_00571830 [Tetrahymena thermophila SB210]|eukprot:XP_001027689.1 hypothetical protein TTHERM_00571830 [Tetrahymena thermophila SB210]